MEVSLGRSQRIGLFEAKLLYRALGEEGLPLYLGPRCAGNPYLLNLR